MRNLLSLLVVVLWSAQVASASVRVDADDSVGVSFGADPVAADNNTAIRFNSDPALGPAVAAGDDLLIGSRVLVGSFSLSDSSIQAQRSEPGFMGFLMSNFTLYGAGAVGDAYEERGHFSSVIDRNADALGLVGKQIYVMVLGSTNNTSLEESVKTAFQVGLFYLDMNSAFLESSQWRFRSETGVPRDSTIDLFDLTQNGTSLRSGAHVVLGSFGQDTSNLTGGLNFSLEAIPEPGTALLALTGGAALLIRRRRR